MSFDVTPDWAKRHNYRHHSVNNTPDFWTFFNKCFIRPQVNTAWRTLKNEIPGNRDQAREVIAKYADDNPAMLSGRAVQLVADGVLINDESFSESYRTGVAKMQSYESPSWRDAKEEEEIIERRLTPLFTKEGKRPKSAAKAEMSEFELVNTHAIAGLREAMEGVNQIEGERDCWSGLPKCELKYNGRPDYISRVELKTRWDRKTGTANSLPKELPFPHLKQVAGYWYLTGLLPTVVIANRLGFRIFKPSEDSLRYGLDDINKACKRRENLLQAAQTTEDLLRMVDPQFDHPFIWNGVNPKVIQEVRQML